MVNITPKFNNQQSNNKIASIISTIAIGTSSVDSAANQTFGLTYRALVISSSVSMIINSFIVEKIV